MTFLINLLLSFFLTLNISANDKIVGGELVQDINEVPFIIKFDRGCGGSIISDKWILTAAHCKILFSDDILAGSLDSTSRSHVLKTDKFFIHPQYNVRTLENDFALIKLKETIILNGQNLESVRLADSDHDADGFQSPGEMATVYGWGLTAENGSVSRYLRKVEVPIVSNQIANAAASYNGKIKDSMIAAGLPEGGKDACQGDSGGPMVTYGAQGEKVLVGVVSWGIGCARKMKYGIYSRVSEAYAWIQETIKNN